MESVLEEKADKRFLWGILLAWIPIIVFLSPTVFALWTVFRGISEQKATGIVAVAGGFTEALLTFGFLALLLFEVAAIVLLLRSISKAHPMRALFSVVSACCGGFMITMLAIFAWLFFVRLPHR